MEEEHGPRVGRTAYVSDEAQSLKTLVGDPLNIHEHIVTKKTKCGLFPRSVNHGPRCARRSDTAGTGKYDAADDFR
jgi:hypothetical protein